MPAKFGIERRQAGQFRQVVGNLVEPFGAELGEGFGAGGFVGEYLRLEIVNYDVGSCVGGFGGLNLVGEGMMY